MPSDSVWPPKPTLADPLAKYDELIEARLPTLSAMMVKWDLIVPEAYGLLPGVVWLLPGMHRLTSGAPVNDRALLVQVLREERGLDYWRARAIVLSYYQRHGMAPDTKALAKTMMPLLIAVALAFVAMFATFFAIYLSFHRDAVLRQPNHGAAILALDSEKTQLHVASFVLLALVYTFWIARYLILRVRRAGAVESPGRKRPSG